MRHRQNFFLRFPWELTHFVVHFLMIFFWLQSPISGNSRGTKTFMGNWKNLVGVKGHHNRKTCQLGEIRSTPLPPDPQLKLLLLHDRFLSYKTESFSIKRILLKVRGKIPDTVVEASNFPPSKSILRNLVTHLDLLSTLCNLPLQFFSLYMSKLSIKY